MQSANIRAILNPAHYSAASGRHTLRFASTCQRLIPFHKHYHEGPALQRARSTIRNTPHYGKEDQQAFNFGKKYPRKVDTILSDVVGQLHSKFNLQEGQNIEFQHYLIMDDVLPGVSIIVFSAIPVGAKLAPEEGTAITAIHHTFLYWKGNNRNPDSLNQPGFERALEAAKLTTADIERIAAKRTGFDTTEYEPVPVIPVNPDGNTGDSAIRLNPN